MPTPEQQETKPDPELLKGLLGDDLFRSEIDRIEEIRNREFSRFVRKQLLTPNPREEAIK